MGMSTTSKSPRKVLLMAYVTAQEELPAYAHRFAPKKYTQPQLFACLVLKAHQKQDYRGIVAFLQDNPELCKAIGLKQVPHYTTLQKACARLLESQKVHQLLGKTLALTQKKRVVKHAAADSTGLETHHASRYFIWRSHQAKDGKKPAKQVSYRKFGKLMILICCATHMILAAQVSAGPTPDVDQLEPLLEHPQPGVTIERLVADAGFDSAFNHHLLREDHGIMSVIPAKHGRPAKDGKLPADKHRRLMKTHFNHKAYRRRPQVETVMSMLKRNLGDSLAGRSWSAKYQDMLLMCLTHNIAIVRSILIG